MMIFARRHTTLLLSLLYLYSMVACVFDPFGPRERNRDEGVRRPRDGGNQQAESSPQPERRVGEQAPEVGGPTTPDERVLPDTQDGRRACLNDCRRRGGDGRMCDRRCRDANLRPFFERLPNQKTQGYCAKNLCGPGPQLACRRMCWTSYGNVKSVANGADKVSRFFDCLSRDCASQSGGAQKQCVDRCYNRHRPELPVPESSESLRKEDRDRLLFFHRAYRDCLVKDCSLITSDYLSCRERCWRQSLPKPPKKP